MSLPRNNHSTHFLKKSQGSMLSSFLSMQQLIFILVALDSLIAWSCRFTLVYNRLLGILVGDDCFKKVCLLRRMYLLNFGYNVSVVVCVLIAELMGGINEK